MSKIYNPKEAMIYISGVKRGRLLEIKFLMKLMKNTEFPHTQAVIDRLKKLESENNP